MMVSGISAIMILFYVLMIVDVVGGVSDVLLLLLLLPSASLFGSLVNRFRIFILISLLLLLGLGVLLIFYMIGMI